MKRALSIVLAVLFAAVGSPAVAQDTNSAAAKAQALIDKGAAYLKTQQQPDGAWHTAQQPPAITAIVLKGLVQNPALGGKKDDSIQKGYSKLLSYQWESGGIYKDLLANYNTAIAISALAAANDPAMKDRIDKAVAYLKSLQWTDQIAGGPKGEAKITPDNAWYGGCGYGREGRPDGSNTQMMLEALHDGGVKSDDPAFKAALKFVSRMQNLSETNDQKWAGNDGGSVYTPANNGESKAGEYTGPDGKRMLRSYGSMTYGMLKSYIYAGLTKDDPRVKAAWDWVSKNWTLDENPGLRASDPSMAQFGLYYYYLTLARALHAYGQPTIVDPQGNKHDWRVEFINKMASLQKPDGSWVGEKKWYEDSPVMVTGLALTALEEAVTDLKEHPAK